MHIVDGTLYQNILYLKKIFSFFRYELNLLKNTTKYGDYYMSMPFFNVANKKLVESPSLKLT